MNGIAFDDKEISNGLKKLVKVGMESDYSKLSASDIKVVELLKEAANIFDEIFIEQICPKLLDIIKLLREDNSEESGQRLSYLLFNKSPLSVMNNMKPFIKGEGIGNGIAVYPFDMKKEELENAIKNSNDADKFTSYYTAIARENGALKPVKYSDIYKDRLEKASKLIENAAMATDNKSLKEYLNATSRALLTNDYNEQQRLWLELDSRVEPTIGPYETYEDRIFGYKGFFEFYINVRDDDETRKLMSYSEHLKGIDATIPIEDGLNFTRKNQSNSPIVVVNEMYFGGEANAGYTTSAFNLPNDEKIRVRYGSKKVLMRNISKAKFRYLAKPIAERLLDEQQLKYLDPNVIQDFVLFHELSHGLGAGEIVSKEGNVPVSVMLKEMFSHIEEARADVTGVFCAMYFNGKGILPYKMEKFYTNYLTNNLLRGIRMGLAEAHAMGEAIQYNFLKENGGIYLDDKENRFGVDMEKIDQAMLKLVEELNSIEASGDYGRASMLTKKYCNISKELAVAYESISDIPVDIMPVFEGMHDYNTLK